MNKTKLLPNLLNKSSVISVISCIICAIIGILIGFIILLFINAPQAPKAIWTILQNFLYFDRHSRQIFYFGSTLAKATPIILCGLSVIFAQKTGLFNIGVAGQYCLAIGTTLWCAIAWHWPWWLCLIVAILSGAIYGIISGVLKVICNVSEVISGIMLNWIALYLTNLILATPKTMNASISETFIIRNVSPNSLLPSLGLNNLFSGNKYVTIALFLTIILCVLIYFLLEKTTFGYEIKATGLNRFASKYVGMKEKKNAIISMAIAGAIAGLAAAFYYLGDIEQWQISTNIPGIGFTGIAVAFLGGLHPIGVIFAGYFVEHITLGGAYLDTRYFNPQIAELIISFIIYACGFVLIIKQLLSKRFAKLISGTNVNDESSTQNKEAK